MRAFQHLLLCGSVLASLSLISCSPDHNKDISGKPNSEHVRSETQSINDWFQARYEDTLKRSPLTQSYLGITDDQDKLDDVSQAAIDEEFALEQLWRKQMKASFNFDRLDTQGKISYRLFEYNAQDTAASHAFAEHTYVFTHMTGEHIGLPTFMVNFHKVETLADAKAYIARLSQAERYLSQYQARAEAQFSNGITLPKFVYGKLLVASRNVVEGAPFGTGADSPIYHDIKNKIDSLKDVSDADKDALRQAAQDALLTSFKPAYASLIAMFEAHEARANDDDGVWKLPDGAAYYQMRLNHYTTTQLTADEIHNIGLKEVARIQGEMLKIMKQVNFDGDLQAFYAHLRTDSQFTFSNDDAGRAQYMKEAAAIIDNMKTKLDSLFITKPKADMIVKRVEPFRQDSAYGAFYEQPAIDGSRPGIYFINLKDVREQPIFLMQALAYHEGIPGHHMQIAIGLELEGIPEFRKQGGHTAYIEGWALYAESVPAELGLYTDPYQDFGRLSMEIFRAARLVVDTGIHAKKWTREQAVQYMLENIANPEGDIRAEIDRYIVWPGQATAYKIGMLKIQELKAKAQSELGDKFSIREFHDIILANGSVPLSLLEELVNEYIADTQK
ncbi:MAG: DUF885 domain-containing protein [Robiginitomaculum sp.]|nr:MAG: DUF885 domain-containing protein [Robiginitomaculum sp.]